MGSQPSLFYSTLKIALGVKLRRSGVSRGDIQAALDNAQGDFFDAALAAMPTPVTIPTFGSGGTLLQEILAFLSSAQGQQFITFIITLITSLIAGG